DAPGDCPTLVLTERVAAVCRLTSGDVEYLADRHRTHLDLAPMGVPDHYRVTPRGYAGVVRAPDCRLVIRPKVPVENLYFLLDPLAPPPAGTDRAASIPGEDLLVFLAGRLAGLLAERAAAGLHRG